MVRKIALFSLLAALFSACAHHAHISSGVQGSASGDELLELDVCLAKSSRGLASKGLLNKMGVGPVIRQFQTEYPNTAPFRSIRTVDTLAQAKDCDIAVEISALSLTRWGVWTYSARTKKLLFEGKARSRGGKIRQLVYGRLKSDPGLVSQIQSERPAAGGSSLTAQQIKEIVQTAVATATQTKPAAKPEAAAKKSSDVDFPGYRRPRRPEDYALIVGIENYSEVPRADFAERDAAAVARHMEAMGVPKRNIVHLSGLKATRTGLLKYLDAWLPRHVTPKSRVYFYFSGHGAPDPETGKAYLVPFDGDPNFLKNTAVPLSSLYAGLSKLKAKEFIVALDACFSGAGGRSVLAKGARPLVTMAKTATTPSNVTLLAAARQDQITATLENQGHGIFTYYFLKGLQGAAISGTRVTVKSLFDYLKPRVQDAARRQNREQTPTLNSPADLVLRTR